MPYLMQMDRTGVMAQGWELGESTMIFGRGEDADVTIPDGSMSRRHFVITFRDGRHEVADLESANGIHVNDDQVTNDTLKAGDIIQAGKTKFYFDIGMQTMTAQQAGRVGSSVRNELQELFDELE